MKYVGYIYCIQNKVNGKKYIGITTNKRGYKSRWNNHISELKNNNHHNENLQNDYNIFGLEAFEFILIHEFQSNTLENLMQSVYKMEQYYIKSWNLLDENFGYNIEGGGNENKIVHKNTKNKISNSNKGKHKKGNKGVNKGKKYKRHKPYKQILCVETGEIFNGSQEVIDKMFPGKSAGTIRNHLNGNGKSAYKYHFKYIE